MRTAWCLHGFLGLSSDWEFLREPLQALGYEVRAVDLWESFARLSPRSLRSWAQALAAEVSADGTSSVLLGYSLGGRLVAHMITEPVPMITHAICVGAHCGLQSEAERAARRAGDHEWAKRFCSEPWEELMTAWNAQEVFRFSRNLSRSEDYFSREVLAQVLEIGSLGAQEDLVPLLREELFGDERRLSFVVGERDEKFLSLARQWQEQLHGNLAVSVVPNAGHRVPWDEPEEFVRTLGDILKPRCEK